MLTVARYGAIFARKSKTKNHLVKNSVKSAKDTMLIYKKDKDYKLPISN